MEKHSECGACLTWCDFIDDDGNKIKGNIFIQKNRSKYEWMRFFYDNGNALCNPSSMTRTEIFKDAQVHGTSGRQLPDFFKWIDTVQKFEIHIVPKVLTKMGWHDHGNNMNTSANTYQNRIRHNVENGLNWYCVIRDMDNEFFRGAFGDRMRNKEASLEQEFRCEKYFLLLDSPDIFCQHAALQYFADNYEYIKEVMENTYHYTKKDFAADELNYGFATMYLSGNENHKI